MEANKAKRLAQKALQLKDSAGYKLKA